jgi:hypothetical protein
MVSAASANRYFTGHRDSTNFAQAQIAMGRRFVADH